MKTQLIHIALTATAVAILSSCDEQTTPGQNTAAPSADATQGTAEEVQTTADELTPPAITADEITTAFAPRISNLAYLTQESIEIESTPKANGDLQVKAHVGLKITEDLYGRVESPAEFGEARKVILALHQAAEKPDSSYLLEMGAETGLLTDEDRKAKALPEHLQQLYNQLVDLSESSCFKPERTAGTTFSIELTMDARWEDGKWVISNIVENQDLLSPLSFLTTKSALGENAPVLTQEFIAARLAEIAAKADEFKVGAEAYNKQREDSVRATLTNRQAAQLEQARKEEEQAQKEAAEAAAKKEWTDFCIAHFNNGCTFTGEWTRDNRFGELTIQISEASLHENGIQFFGAMFDSKLPQASINISGRCELTRNDAGTSKVDVTLYQGAYDPDEPTAEVYDQSDGRLILSFDKNGRLQGVMTCASWIENPQKNFKLHFKPANATGKSKK